MPAVWWFAVLGQPVFALPLAQVPDKPAVFAIASADPRLRPPCLSLRCLRTGWESPTDAKLADNRTASPFAKPRALPRIRSFGLYAPASRREWTANDGHDWRVGTRFGFTPIREGDTQLKVEFGGGYRFQPYVDDGTSAAGPVARSRIELTRKLGPSVQFSQQVRVESGRYDTYLRNVIALDVQLEPNWRLRSQVQTTHDSDAPTSTTTGSVQLRYSF
jgi:hypothetical protein